MDQPNTATANPTTTNSTINSQNLQQNGQMPQQQAAELNAGADQTVSSNQEDGESMNQTSHNDVGKSDNPRILVVEDEVDARTMFVDLLTSEGYETSSAVDGVDALAKAAADTYDLILLDIVMPNKDGIEVLSEVKANPDKYGTPVIVMLTNISGDAAVEKAMNMGAAGFRLKVDTEPTQLLDDVHNFLNGKVQNLQAEPVTKSMA